VNVKQGLLEKHLEGRYYMSHNGGWIDAGTDALEAQRKRKQLLALNEYNRLNGKASTQNSVLYKTAQAGSHWQQLPKNILPTAKPAVLIPRPSASIGPQLIRSSIKPAHIVEQDMLVVPALVDIRDAAMKHL
jgi:hypothetical protein